MKTQMVGLNIQRRFFLAAILMITILLLGSLAGCAPAKNGTDAKVLTQNLSEPLNGATSAKVDINTGTGNLAIDRLSSGEQMLAGGTLEYMENQDLPITTVTTTNGQTNFTVKASNIQQSGFHFPWEACNGETNWQIHLNPSLPSDITAHSGGGNVSLNLAGMVVSRVMADTGGGNMDVILPNNTADLNVTAKTGAGNVTVEIGSGITGSHTIIASSGAGNVEVRLPNGIAARIHVTSGAGKPIIDPGYNKIDDKTYQSPNYDNAANRVEITLNSGAGNVTVSTK